MENETTPPANNSNNSMPIIIGIILVLIVGAGYLIATRNNEANNTALDQESMAVEDESAIEESMMGDDSMMQEDMSMDIDDTMMAPVEGTEVMDMDSEVKVFNITASNYKYSLNEIRVNQGDKVRINFVNGEGMHDMRIDEFGVATPVLETAGATADVEFVADQAGTFEFYCSVGNHRQMGMKGNLIVTSN